MGEHISGCPSFTLKASPPTSYSGHSLSEGWAIRASLPRLSPGSAAVDRKGPNTPFTTRQWLPQAFLRSLHIASADVVPPIHSEFPGASPGLLLPSRKLSQMVPSSRGHWFRLERRREGEERRERGSQREEGEEMGKQRRKKAIRGLERIQHLPDSTTHLTSSPCAGSEPDRLGFQFQLQPSLAV